MSATSSLAISNVRKVWPTPKNYQADSPVVDKWNEYMKDVMVMEMDPETGAQPKMQQVFFLA